MTQPWTIGWDEDDTRIRLSFIARAWVAMRGAVKPERASRAELVWPWLFFYIFSHAYHGSSCHAGAADREAWLQALGGEKPYGSFG